MGRENFRLKWSEQAFKAEFREHAKERTSVPNGKNWLLGRKSKSILRRKLPCQTIKTGLRGGSLTGSAYYKRKTAVISHNGKD